MKRGCQEHEALLLEHIHGDLEGLQRTKLEAHLEHCESCAAARRTLQDSFAAAKQWIPETPADELERKIQRLTPFIEDQRPAFRPSIFGAGLAFAAAVAVVLMVRMKRPEPIVEPLASTVQDAGQRPSPKPTPKIQETPVKVVRREAGKRLKILSSEDWDGRIERRGARTNVQMNRGFVVMRMEQLKGRPLRLRAPQIEVEGLSGRFFVEARQGVPTVVGVLAGRVQVKSRDGVEVLTAGSTRAYDSQGHATELAKVQAKPFLNDPYLLKPPKTVVAKKLPRVVKSQIVASAPAPSVLEALAEIDELQRKGQLQRAIALSSRALKSAKGRQRALLRFERARLLQRRGDGADHKRAFSEFKALAKRSGEVAIQSSLKLCEIALRNSGCEALGCLEQLSAQNIGEAKTLIARWKLDKLVCEAVHKNTVPSQLK